MKKISVQLSTWFLRYLHFAIFELNNEQKLTAQKFSNTQKVTTSFFTNHGKLSFKPIWFDRLGKN